MPITTISIIGCGWLGRPLAERLVADGLTVRGTTTSAEKRDALRAAGIKAYQLRFNPEPEGEGLDELLASDAIVIAIPPRAGAQGEACHPAQIRHLTEAIRTSGRQPYLVYVSSTSVYPEVNREVSEDEVVTPEQSAAPALVEAEQLALALGNATVLRCGGLMGDDRIPAKYVAGKQGITTGGVPVNYLHREDGVGILQQLLTEPRPGETYNAVAPQHPTREAVYRKSCLEFGYALPTFAEPAEPVPYKIISPAKWLQHTGYVFQFPDPLAFRYGRP